MAGAPSEDEVQGYINRRGEEAINCLDNAANFIAGLMKNNVNGSVRRRLQRLSLGLSNAAADVEHTLQRPRATRRLNGTARPPAATAAVVRATRLTRRELGTAFMGLSIAIGGFLLFVFTFDRADGWQTWGPAFASLLLGWGLWLAQDCFLKLIVRFSN
ncbi:hypothetical protein KFL_000270020 [Klebsormidium nitens]|uniref:Uncharacterized protein n=1 Tax=Klebsormidium nitens TaxID=105231 RepID=A0A1Y1HMK8_KLENI|nr:hypothetical protein KFL_000270020 [Klebsormidium nitens]|eukprot:GAQ79243.1 hypothetical protein KFL_000270020 [Klebsormidium nitens]